MMSRNFQGVDEGQFSTFCLVVHILQVSCQFVLNVKINIIAFLGFLVDRTYLPCYLSLSLLICVAPCLSVVRHKVRKTFDLELDVVDNLTVINTVLFQMLKFCACISVGE